MVKENPYLCKEPSDEVVAQETKLISSTGGKRVYRLFILFLVAIGLLAHDYMLSSSKRIELENRRIKQANAYLEAELQTAEHNYNQLVDFSGDFLEAALGKQVYRLSQVIERINGKDASLSSEERYQLASMLVREGNRLELDPLLLLAVIHVESRFNHDAISNKGARGMMQLMPKTEEWLVSNERIPTPINIEENEGSMLNNVVIGSAYLRKLLDVYRSLDWALMAYNYGPGRVNRILRGDDPEPENFWSYARKVRRNLSRFQIIAANIEAENKEALK